MESLYQSPSPKFVQKHAPQRQQLKKEQQEVFKVLNEDQLKKYLEAKGVDSKDKKDKTLEKSTEKTKTEKDKTKEKDKDKN